MKKKKIEDLLKDLPVNTWELNDLYNQCFENFLNGLNDIQSDEFKMWKYSYLGYLDLPVADRVALSLLEQFNFESIMGCSNDIDFTFFFPKSKVFKLDTNVGFLRLLYQTDTAKFISMMGLLLELLTEHPVISKLIDECGMDSLERRMLAIAENDFVVSEIC